MTIVQLGTYNPSEILTGPEKFSKRIYHEMEVDKIDITFITYYQDGNMYSLRKKIFGKEIISINDKGNVYQMGLVTMLLYLVRTKIDIIHITNFQRFVMVAILVKIFKRIKVLYTVHGLLKYEYENYRSHLPLIYKTINLIIERCIVISVDKNIFVSSILLLQYQMIYKNGNNENIIHNGIDDIFINKSVRKHNSFSIVFVGEPERQEKGYEYLMQCVKEINYPVTVNIISRKPLIFDSPSKDITITNLLKMPSSNYASFLTTQDIFLSLSEFDTFSIAAAEAMAVGVIPIVTKQTGLSSIIIHGENGFIVDQNDVKSVITIIQHLKNDSLSCRRISDNAKNSTKMLTWNKIASQYYSVYKSLVNVF